MNDLNNKVREAERDRRIRKLLFGLLGGALLIGLVFIPAVTAKADGYNPDDLSKNRQSWMKYLPDTMQISQINLPATHDSGTWGVRATKSMQAQTVTNAGDLKSQMEGGIRVLDIRLRRSNSSGSDRSDPYKMVICHGDASVYADCYTTTHGNTKLTLDHVLKWADEFVAANPSEVVVITLSRERDKDEIHPLVLQLLDEYYHGNPTKGRYSHIVYYRSGEIVPTLGEVRGKVILLHDGLGESSMNEITPYESNYFVEKLDYFKTKKERLEKILADSKNFNQEYFKLEDSFKDDGKRNTYGTAQAPERVYAPMCISTNLTDIDGIFTALLGQGPKGCWRLLFRSGSHWRFTKVEEWNCANFQDVNLNTSDAKGNKRIGWWQFDFPQNKQVQAVIDSNKVPVKQYKIDLGGIPSGYKTVEELPVDVSVVLENGYKLTCYNMKWQSSSQSYLLDFGKYAASDIKTVSLTYKNDPTYAVEWNRSYFEELSATELLNLLTEKRIDYYNVHKIEDGELKEVKIGVYFDEDKENPKHPLITDPKDFLDNFAKPILGYRDSEHTGELNHVIYYAGDLRFGLKEIKKLGTTSKPYYELIIMAPAYDNNYKPINYYLKGFAEFNENGAYTLSNYTDAAFWLHMKNTEETYWYEIPITWNDGWDSYKMRSQAIEEIKTKGIHHTAKVFSGGKVVTDEDISLENLKVTDKGFYAKVRRYGDDNKELLHSFTLPEINYHLLSDNRKYTPKTEVTLQIKWDDFNNESGYRPEEMTLHVYESEDLKDEIIFDLSEENGWTTTVTTWAFGENSGRSISTFPFAVSSYPYIFSQYGVDKLDVETKTPDGPDHIPRVTMTIYFKLQSGLEPYQSINGKIIWNEGDLVIDHRGVNPKVTVLRDGEEMELTTSKQRWDEDCETYGFEPLTDFPLFQEDRKTRYNYEVLPEPLEGYIESVEKNPWPWNEDAIDGGDGFNIVYTRKVSVSGTVDWQNEERGAQTQPKVTLLCNGEPYGSETETKDWKYSFNDLPIADEQGNPYNYSVEISLDVPNCVVVPSQIQRDNATGNVIADGVIIPYTQKIPVEIPIKLNLENANPDIESDSFNFILNFPEDIANPMVLELNRENAFEGTFRMEDMPEPGKAYTVTIRQDLNNRKPYWQYDDSVKEVKLQVRYIDDGPVAQIDWGEEEVPTFTNTYVPVAGTVSIQASKKIENLLKDFGVEVPDQEFFFLLTDENGWVLDSESITGAGDIQFNRLMFTTPGEYKYHVAESIGDFPGWQFDENSYEVTVTVTDEGGQLSAVADTEPELTNTYAMVAKNVDVKVVWVDGDLAEKIRPEEVNITLKGDGEVLREDTLTQDTWTKKLMSVPLYGEKGPLEISLEAEDVDGYSKEITGDVNSGFIIKYTHKVSVSGKVDWQNEESGSQTQPKVTLLRNDEPCGSETETVNWQYSFENLPIADEQGNTYNYSVELSLNEPNCIVVPSQIQRDPDTGNVTIDGVIIPNPPKIEVEIPIKLNLENADPAIVSDSFQFILNFPEDIADPMVLELNRENAFEGTFRMEDMPEPGKAYTVTIRQDPNNQKPYWQYDDSVKEVKLQVRYIDDGPVAQIDCGEEKVPTFTNTYVPVAGTVSIQASKKIENLLQDFGVEVPAQEFSFLLTDEDGNVIDSKNITGAGTIQFDRLIFTTPGVYKYQVTESIGDFPGWQFDENSYDVTVTVTDEGGQLSAVADAEPELTNTYAMVMQNVDVKAVWIDGDLADKRRPEEVDITLKGDGEVLREDTLTQDTWTKKLMSVPLYGEEGPLEISLEAEDVEGYSVEITGDVEDGFTVTYTALISISGSVDWEITEFRTDDQPLVQLMRGEEAIGEPVSTTDFGYIFKDLPEADEDNKPYEYSITAELPGYDVNITYEEIVRDEAGNIVADAVIQGKVQAELAAYNESGKPTEKFTAGDSIVIKVENISPDIREAIKECIGDLIINGNPSENVSFSDMTYTLKAEEAGNYSFILKKFVLKSDVVVDVINEPELSLKVLPLTVKYKIIKGADQKILTTADSALFASNADCNKFVRVEVDGKTIGKEFYEESGSSITTEITFNKEFIKTLSVGKHSFAIVSSDGSASTNFSVVKDSPDTGDNSNLGWIIVMMITSLIVGTLARMLRKRMHD